MNCNDKLTSYYIIVVVEDGGSCVPTHRFNILISKNYYRKLNITKLLKNIILKVVVFSSLNIF